jgi:hypothetical protein
VPNPINPISAIAILRHGGANTAPDGRKGQTHP